MGRKRKTLNEWETAHIDPSKEKNWCSHGASLEDCKQVSMLSHATYRLLSIMLRACAGKKEFTCTQSFAKNRGLPPSTFEKSKKELIDKGFIQRVESGKLTRTASKFIWSNEWKKHG